MNKGGRYTRKAGSTEKKLVKPSTRPQAMGRSARKDKQVSPAKAPKAETGAPAGASAFTPKPSAGDNSTSGDRAGRDASKK